MDWERLKNKIDCGADFVVTQLFFDNADFFEFRDHLMKLGVTGADFSGAYSARVTSATQTKRITALCGAKLPAAMVAGLEKNLADNDEAAMHFGIDSRDQANARNCWLRVRPECTCHTLNKAAFDHAGVKEF